MVCNCFADCQKHETLPFISSLAFVMTIQLIGFGMAGIVRRFLIKPAAMYWPSVLGSVALFVNFHEVEEKNDHSRYKMSRFKFFTLAAIAFFFYTWLPQYFVTVLQIVSIVCFFTPDPFWRLLGSGNKGEGVGIGALTFDWQQVGGSSLTTPFWATLQYSISVM